MAESPGKALNGYVNVSVISNGEEIKSIFRLISFTIRKEVNKIGKAVISFEAGNMPKGENPESDLPTFGIGNEIAVEAGYGDKKELIFKGIVISHQFNIEENNETAIQIECRDFAFPMTLTRKDHVFKNKTDNGIIREIAESNGLKSTTIEIGSTKDQHSILTQYQCTDWDFILSRAEVNEMVVIVDNEDIFIKEPSLDKSPALKINYGRDVIEFDGKLSASSQRTIIKAITWDPETQKRIVVTNKKPALNDQGEDDPGKIAHAVTKSEDTITTSATISQEALQKMADSRALRNGLSKILGTCKFCGSSKAVHGELIELESFGKRFDGNAYIGSVEHEYNEYGWTTTIGMGLPDTKATEAPQVSAPAASGYLPGIQGLHIGKVKNLKGSGPNEFKIEVEIPVLNAESNKVWARPGSFWASNAYGAFFIPDIDDEVILGFLNNDPCHPVILGSLYSNKQQPPYELTTKNNIRAIVSKSKLKIELEEDEKVITIETPGKNKVIISDKDKGIQLIDQHKNKIVMNDSGILIESSKEIVLKAKTNVTIDAGNNLGAKAKANIDMKGLKINAKADMELTVKGTAKAEISASGQTVVKGAMVMIN
ncbi:MAG: type VI secretion system tip protein VgrG [Dysgonamonadaceae bacterium]|jgi:Rhs element Vgr protein|nr:type VI secretion system tip protein VgrG [Dysgonamonadaceae bacterium]